MENQTLWSDIMDKWLDEYVEMIMEKQKIQNKIFKKKQKHLNED